jgi:hypothetical protein
MKKKISILTLTFLFFTSTTGLPLVLHYCEMMESVSLEICDKHKEKVVKTSCCEDVNNAEVYFTNGYDPCCSSKLVDAKVKDNFVTVKTELSQKVLSSIILVLNRDNNYSFSSFNKFYTDTSPPPLINNLYLTNSILLI